MGHQEQPDQQGSRRDSGLRPSLPNKTKTGAGSIQRPFSLGLRSFPERGEAGRVVTRAKGLKGRCPLIIDSSPHIGYAGTAAECVRRRLFDIVNNVMCAGGAAWRRRASLVRMRNAAYGSVTAMRRTLQPRTCDLQSVAPCRLVSPAETFPRSLWCGAGK